MLDGYCGCTRGTGLRSAQFRSTVFRSRNIATVPQRSILRISLAVFLSLLSIDMARATMIHPSSPTGFPSQVPGQPANEKPFLVLPVGFPAEDGEAPDIKKQLPQRISHFSRVNFTHEIWKLRRCVCICNGFCCKMFSMN